MIFSGFFEMLWLDNPLLKEKIEFKSEMVFLFVLKLSFECAEIYLPVTIKVFTSTDIQELWILQNQMGKSFPRVEVQVFLIFLSQDFRPGVEKA